MFDLSNDYLYIYRGALFVYLGTFALLWWLHWPIIALFYHLIAYSIAFTDEVVDEYKFEDMEYNEWIRQASLLHPIDFHEAVIGDDDILAILHHGNDDPILPASYIILDSYMDIFLKKKKKPYKFIKRYEYAIGVVHEINYENVKNFAKYQLSISDAFRQTYASSNVPQKLRLLKYKTMAFVTNSYLLTSLFARGLYAKNEYDLDNFKASEYFRNMQFQGFRNLYPSMKQYITSSEDFLEKKSSLNSSVVRKRITYGVS